VALNAISDITSRR